MKQTNTRTVKVLLVLLVACAIECDARGGRGRGGSFGGIFGGWRKYKKTPSSGPSRRVTNGSPMHTSATKSTSSNSGSSAWGSLASKSQSSYPKQQMPIGGSGVGMGGYGGPSLPPGSAYYTNPAAMPPSAIYYSQPPLRSSSGNGDFLFGMLTGHVLSNALFGNRHHVTHVYQQSPQNAENSSGNGKVIIINNGAESNNSTFDNGTNVPLASFNASSETEERSFNAEPPNQPDQAAAPSAHTGIMCVPLMFNETDPNDPEKSIFVQKTVCFPSPPPPPAVLNPPAAGCTVEVITEPDPYDPTKSIEVQRETCMSTTPPPPIAGDIDESVPTD